MITLPAVAGVFFVIGIVAGCLWMNRVLEQFIDAHWPKGGTRDEFSNEEIKRAWENFGGKK